MAAWAEQQRDPVAKVHQLRCAQCGSRSGLYAHGWHGYRTDDAETDETPTLSFFCPTCSAREFGRS
jgi:hypothetical protein